MSQEVRLRYVVTLNPAVPGHVRNEMDQEVTFLPMEAINVHGGFIDSRTRPVKDVLTGYSYFENGDVAYAKVTPCFENGKITVLENLGANFGFGTTEITVARPNDLIAKRYLFYVLQDDAFKQYGQAAMTGAGGLKRVPESFVKNFKVQLPELPLQEAIVAFLDRETAEIDAFIADQEELINLLAERRTATVVHAVTKGLDPTVDMKKIGFDWIGLIPGHWNLQRLWSLFEREKNVGYPQEQMLSVFREYGVVPKDSRANLNKTAENRNIYQLVEPGWLVSNRMKAWQGSVGISTHRGIVSGHYICFRPKHSECSPYLNYLFRSSAYTAGYKTISRGVRIGQAEIDNDEYRLLPVLLPPLTEQHRIVEYLDQEMAEIDAAIADAQQAVALSKERRAAVISAAVTGKIDVRGFIAPEANDVEDVSVGVA